MRYPVAVLRALAWIGLSLFALTSCAAGEYTVVVRFETPTLAAQVERLEVHLVESCGALATTGADPIGPIQTLDLRRGGTTTTFSAIAAGTYGLYARGYDGATCQVVGAGCDTVSVEAGGEGELIVTVLSIAGPLCPAGMPCTAGVCGVMDAGVPDGGMDTGVDAPMDTAVPCSCVDCAGCDDAGACIADNALCGAGEYCDLIGGCTMGTPCSSDAECIDDGNPCTSVACDIGLGICVPTAMMDGTACDDSGTAGQCRAGACCTGCWDGGACVGGDAVAACGAGGERCMGCDDANVCTADGCNAGACENPPVAGSCPGGECTGGACCTGCIGGGGTCESGDTAAACGAGGASCAACDDAACPPESCGAGGVCAPLGATSVDIRRRSVFAVAPDGTLWVWGDNFYGELGLGDTMDRSSPVQLGTDTDWAQMSAGRRHVCGVKTSGQLWCWGAGQGSGRLGLGAVDASRVPMRVGTDSDWSMVTSGTEHTCAVKTGGTLWCWGDDRAGRAGAGTGMILTTPTRVGAESDWTFVDLRSDHTCAVRGAGLLYCWGLNSEGQLGTGGGGNESAPARVGTDTDWRSVATGGSVTAGGGFSCGLKMDGSRWCWGQNGFLRRYGSGVGGSETSPLRIDAGPWRSIALASQHGCGIQMDRSLWCWGANDQGQTGASGGVVGTPTRVGAATNHASVGAGSDSSCSAATTGAVVCFGNNSEGQLGNGGGGGGSMPVRACL